MASSYLPEGTYVVCTNHTGNSYRELIADKDARKVSVFYEDKRAFLTKADKKISEDFTCKTGWSKGLSGGAFLGGTAAAFAVAAASAAVVPVIGWAVAGILAVAAIGVALNGILNNPQCSGALGNELSQWKLYHAGVKLNKHNAVLSCSILVCGEGGVLMPFISQTAAKNAASAIGRLNKGDITLNFVVNGLAGYGFGYASITAFTGFKAFSMFVGGAGTAIATGKFLVQPTADWVGDQYASSQSNERFEKIQTAKGKPPINDENLLDVIMGASNPAEDVRSLIDNKNQIIQAMKENGASKEAIASFQSAVFEAERTGTFGKKNPISQQVLKDIKAEKYGIDIKAIFTNKSGTSTGKHGKSGYDKSTQLEQEKIDMRKNQMKWSFLKGAGTIIGIAQPFISSIFDRQTLLTAIEHQKSKEEENDQNGINIISTNY